MNLSSLASVSSAYQNTSYIGWGLLYSSAILSHLSPQWLHFQIRSGSEVVGLGTQWTFWWKQVDWQHIFSKRIPLLVSKILILSFAYTLRIIITLEELIPVSWYMPLFLLIIPLSWGLLSLKLVYNTTLFKICVNIVHLSSGLYFWLICVFIFRVSFPHKVPCAWQSGLLSFELGIQVWATIPNFLYILYLSTLLVSILSLVYIIHSHLKWSSMHLN
jgi:hypothetical protein